MFNTSSHSILLKIADMKQPSSSSRRLVTIRRISRITAIEESQYEVVTLDGWNVVVRRDDGFHIGQLVFYVEVDSFLPSNRYFWEYCAGSHTTLDNKRGFLVTTTIICKHISQGLIFNLRTFGKLSKVFEIIKRWFGEDIAVKKLMDMPLQELLGVKKWEHIHHGGSNEGLGTPPIFFPQPGCERAQNLPCLFKDHEEETYQVTEKLDGIPMSVYAVETSSQWFSTLPPLPGNEQQIGTTRLGVCSRSQDLVEASTSYFWCTAKQQHITEKIGQAGHNIVVQGELCGSSVMGNTMGFSSGEHKFFVFDIFDIDKQQHLRPDEVTSICNRLGWDHVPVIFNSMKLSKFANSINDLLVKAEGIGVKGQMREGLVFKGNHSKFRFKVISNTWLLATGKE
ncbi:RNA ligase-domain-containing protein [Jackrogersella minutella]|nr:RNA ligase-domain-containing protein [Jackrogersella minutella]